MKKILNIIKSRFFICALLILLEFVLLMLVCVLLYKHFIPITILAILFYFIIFIYIINKDETIEFKLPWVILVLLLPIIGAFIYVVLNSNENNKNEYQNFKNHLKKVDKYDRDKSLNNIKNREAYLQAKYLCNSKEISIYENSEVTYYDVGEKFYKDLLVELNKAEKFIFMEYFIVSKGKVFDSILEILKRKVKDGIEVYFLYDDFGCMTSLPENYYKHLNEVGIKSLPSNKFRPILSKIHNNRDHRKITVIDGKVGFTGGINLADEYINEIVKYGHWKDSGIKIEGEAVKNLTKLFIGIWNFQSKQILPYDKYLNIETKKFHNKGIVIPYGSGPNPFYEENLGKNVYLNMIHMSEKYIYITTPYLICDNELFNALRLASKRGVDVRIIMPHIPDKKTIQLMSRSNYYNLIKDGVKIYEYEKGFIHSKEFVCDDKFAICGTINLDYRSLVHNFECGVWIYNLDCIKAMKKNILSLFKQSIEIDLKSAKLKGIKKFIAEIMKIYTPLM